MKLCRLLTSGSEGMRNLAKTLMLNSNLRYIKSYLDNLSHTSYYLEILAKNDIYFSFNIMGEYPKSFNFSGITPAFRVEIFNSYRSITTLISVDYAEDMEEIEEIIKRWS